MIVTRNWLQEFIDISKISTKSICEALNSIGLEVEKSEKVFIPNGVVVGYILDCQKHQDADKLNVCQVDLGDSKVQIVCGASNVAKGQYVAVATVGTTLGEDFKIKKAKLRGEDSHGMICSSTEIGLTKIEDGILVLDDSIGELKLGKDLNEYTNLDFETIEIELTANRGDCLSIHGVAREISTYFNISFYKSEHKIASNNDAIGQILDIACDNNISSNLIYKAADIKDFKLPLIQRIRASIVGINRKTDIETAIEYATHATGVLLNVYTKAIAIDKKNDIISLKIKKDKKDFDTVNGKVLLSTIGIEAGHISQKDDKVILEASYTAPDILAQKVFDTKIKTGDIYYKSSRGSEPDLECGIDYLIDLLSCFGGTIYNGSEQFVNDLQDEVLTVNIDKINSIIGQDIDKEQVINILTSLDLKVKNSGVNVLNIIIPSFRHDIKNIADITEEIVRMIGIDNIKAKPLAIDEVNRVNQTSKKIKLNNDIRAKAVSNHFFETITYVFSQRELLEKYNFEVVGVKKDILNPITNELNTFRTTLALNLVQAVSHNQSHGFKSISFFESGIIFNKTREESKCLGFIFSGENENESIANSGKPKDVGFFDFSQRVANCIGDFDLEPMKKIANKFIHPYQNANILQNGNIIGTMYKLHPSVSNDFNISDSTFIALINFDTLLTNTIQAKDISKYQSSKRDLSIVAPKELPYKNIKKSIDSLKIPEIKQYNLVDIYTDEKLGENESLTIKFILQSEDKTLEENDITTIMDKILSQLDKKLNIGIR